MLERCLLKMFNRKAGSKKSKPEEILRRLDIRSGESVADIGSGGGYYSCRFAEKVGDQGHVYAVDIKAKNLAFVQGEANKRGINEKLTLVLAEGENTNLPYKSVDLAFSRNAFHHISNPARYFKKLKKALRPEARVVIIENKKEKGIMSRLGHCSSKKNILGEMRKAGYRLERWYDFLDQQWFLIFSLSH